MSTIAVGRRKSVSESVGILQDLRHEVGPFARLEAGVDRAPLIHARVHGARQQLDAHHGDDGRHGPALAGRGQPVQRGHGGEHRDGEQDEPERRAARRASGTPSSNADAGREQSPRMGLGHRTIAEPLEPDRAQDRDRDHRQVPHAPGVVQIHVAERHLEEERLEPAGRDDHVQHEEPREDQASAERHHERSSRAIAPREQDREQHHRADVRARGGAERERPGRPHPVRRERAVGDVRRGTHRLSERVVSAMQARRADERQARDQDRQARERHRDQEQRPCVRRRSIRRPRRARTDATDVATRNAASSSEHITSPWLMWALATCDHANADERQPRQAARPPIGVPVARCPHQHDRRPAQEAGERHRDRHVRCRHQHPQAQPATVATGRDNDSLRRNQKRPSPAEQRVEDDERPHRRAGRQRARTGASAARTASRSAGRRRTDSRASRSGSTAGCVLPTAPDPGTRTGEARTPGCRGVRSSGGDGTRTRAA